MKTKNKLYMKKKKDVHLFLKNHLINCFYLNKKRISAESIANELNISLDLLNKITQLNHQKPNTSKLQLVI